jgi:archaeosine synthase alpha-subunit
VAGYLEKTRDVYRFRVAYCIGLFREALIRGSKQAGVPVNLILPSKDLINAIIEEDCPFQEGSLSMDEYLQEFHKGLTEIKSKI